MYLLAQLWHNRSPFSKTCKRYRMSVACSSATLSEPLKAKKKTEGQRKSEPRVNVSCISQNCFRLHADSTKQREENHLIESRTKNLIIMAIISSDLHFSSFAHAFVRLLRSILDTCRSTPFSRSRSFVAFHFFAYFIQFFLCIFYVDWEWDWERERTRVVAAMLCLC